MSTGTTPKYPYIDFPEGLVTLYGVKRAGSIVKIAAIVVSSLLIEEYQKSPLLKICEIWTP